MNKLLIVVALSFLLIGCSGVDSGPELTIKEVLERDYPPEKTDDVVTSDYQLFRFEELKGEEKGWCVNFVFRLKNSHTPEPRRWQGFGDVVEKDGKYVYSFSDGCKLSDAEEKEFAEFKK